MEEVFGVSKNVILHDKISRLLIEKIGLEKLVGMEEESLNAHKVVRLSSKMTVFSFLGERCGPLRLPL